MSPQCASGIPKGPLAEWLAFNLQCFHLSSPQPRRYSSRFALKCQRFPVSELTVFPDSFPFAKSSYPKEVEKRSKFFHI